MAIGFTFDTITRLFTSSAGETVDISAVRDTLRFTLDEVISREVLPLGVQFQNGEISFATWATEMERLVKTTQTMAGAIGGGGWSNVTQSVWGRIGNEVKAQYGYLRSFGREIEQGLALDGDFLRRAAMYIRNANSTFEAVVRMLTIADDSITEERRLLTLGAQHCSECLDYAAQSWVAKGTLPDIGEECSCHSNDLCFFQYR